MSIIVNLTDYLTVVETVTLGDVGSDNTVTYDANNRNTQFTSSTSVPVTKVSSYNLTLSSGSGAIDLTALPGKTGDETVDFDGLRVQFAQFYNPSTNANAITVAKSGSNGWTGAGSDFSVTIPPGGRCNLQLEEAGPNVSSTVKALDVSGTGSQVLKVKLVAG